MLRSSGIERRYLIPSILNIGKRLENTGDIVLSIHKRRHRPSEDLLRPAITSLDIMKPWILLSGERFDPTIPADATYRDRIRGVENESMRDALLQIQRFIEDIRQEVITTSLFSMFDPNQSD